MIKLYGYKKCNTCRNAEKALDKKKIKYQFIDITINPPAKSALKKMITQSGEELKRFFNTSGVVYKEKKIKDKLSRMSETEKITLLAGNGRLLKRPLVTDGKKTTVGFREDDFLRIWKA